MIDIIPPVYEGLSGIITTFHNVYKSSFSKYIVATPSSTNSFPGRVGANDLLKRDMKNNKHWCSQEHANSSVIITFNRHTLKLTHYTMRSREDYIGHMPQNWMIEASNDLESWDLIKIEGPNIDLIEINAQKMYNISTSMFYRHYKFTDIKNVYFCFSKIELFGELIGSIAVTCLNKHQKQLPMFIYVLIMSITI